MTMKDGSDAVDKVLSSKYNDGRSDHCRMPYNGGARTIHDEVTHIYVRGIHVTFYVNPGNAIATLIWSDTDYTINTQTVELEEVIPLIEKILQGKREESEKSKSM